MFRLAEFSYMSSSAFREHCALALSGWVGTVRLQSAVLNWGPKGGRGQLVDMFVRTWLEPQATGTPRPVLHRVTGCRCSTVCLVLQYGACRKYGSQSCQRDGPRGGVVGWPWCTLRQIMGAGSWQMLENDLGHLVSSGPVELRK